MRLIDVVFLFSLQIIFMCSTEVCIESEKQCEDGCFAIQVTSQSFLTTYSSYLVTNFLFSLQVQIGRGCS